VVLRAACTLCLALALQGCQEQIVHDLSEAEANRVVSRLSLASLGAHKEQQSDGRWAIAVSGDSVVPALAFLENNRVLVSRVSAAGSSVRGSIVPSREEQWFRYERAMAQSIEESLGALAGVLEARVHLNLPEIDPLFGTERAESGSGSVLLLVNSRYVASNDEVAALVGGAAGLPPSQVTVLKSLATGRLEAEPREELPQAPREAQNASGKEVQRVVAGALGAAGVIGSLIALRRRRVPRAVRRLDDRDDLE